MKLHAEARKRVNPHVSFDDLGVPFQDYHCMDLRESGLVSFGMDDEGKCAVALSRTYRGVDMQVLKDVMDSVIGKEYGQ